LDADDPGLPGTTTYFVNGAMVQANLLSFYITNKFAFAPLGAVSMLDVGALSCCYFRFLFGMGAFSFIKFGKVSSTNEQTNRVTTAQQPKHKLSYTESNNTGMLVPWVS